MNSYFSGTSNLVLPVKNKTYFPAAFQSGTRLTYYASIFSSIEINASFYRIPVSRTLVKWAAEVPDDFAFSFKLVKEITHAQQQQFNLAPVPVFMDALNAMDKRGCLLVQLPPKFGPDITQLTGLLAELRRYNWPVAVEFRHAGWYDDNVFELLSAFDTAMVFHDMPKSASPLISTSETLIYMRFHGPEGGYRGSYADDYLYEYAGYIREWMGEGKSVYCYFNNTLGAAVQNLQTLNRFVG
ncbi:MAG TPA: DUF72 domain-containing protein [Mucilaginibacter sp.]|nr:DUF72 domain-containing protein [Mucilaginibacter sp.]